MTEKDLEICANFIVSSTKFPRGFWVRPKKELEIIGSAILANYCSRHNLTAADCRMKFTTAFFQAHALSPILRNCFDGSIYKAYKATFPNEEIHEWQMSSVSQGFWTSVRAREALTWLLIEKNKWTYEEALSKFTYNYARENKMSGILDKFYESSPRKAVDDIFKLN